MRATREVLRKIFGQFLYFVRIHDALRLLDLGSASARCANSVALTLVLAFATALPFRIVRHSLEGDRLLWLLRSQNKCGRPMTRLRARQPPLQQSMRSFI